MGTPRFAVPSLEKLIGAGHEIVAVVTQPDRPAGRGRKHAQPPVKVVALDHGLHVVQPETARGEWFARWVGSLAADLGVVVGFGRILPVGVLTAAGSGFVNLHASLLPRYRGAAPVQRAIMRGERQTGVTTMYMDAGMDTGDIILQEAVQIGEDETAGELEDRLARVGAALLARTVSLVGEGRAPRVPQDHGAATYAPALGRGDERIDWSRDAREVVNLVRGMNPVPGAYTTWEGKRLKIWRAVALDESPFGDGGRVVPGSVVRSEGGAAGVVCAGRGAVLVAEVQVEGGRRMDWELFARGHTVPPGTVLGDPGES